MKAFYTDLYTLPLPPTHRFPMQKYTLLRQRVSQFLIPPVMLQTPPAATDTQLHYAHSPDYVRRVQQGELTEKEIRRIGFPWTPEMVERSRRSSGATIAACYAALSDGVAVNLAGGTHHAFYDHGQGYCVFNDSAVAAKVMCHEAGLNRIVIIDLDVHQGDGTASILADDNRVFTFSVHAARNFPFHKEKSNLDMPLPDGTTDEEYLYALAEGLSVALSGIKPDLVIYLAGADPFVGDHLGRLAITKSGLAVRDRYVLETCSHRHIPIAITMAGGYGKILEDTVDIHFQTIKLAAEFYQRRNQILI